MKCSVCRGLCKSQGTLGSPLASAMKAAVFSTCTCLRARKDICKGTHEM
jgi:hypothetical protein